MVRGEMPPIPGQWPPQWHKPPSSWNPASLTQVAMCVLGPVAARVNCGRIMMATSLLLASATLASWLVGHTWPLASALMCPAQAKVSCVPLVIQCPHLTTPHVFHQCTCASGVSIWMDQVRCPGKQALALSDP